MKTLISLIVTALSLSAATSYSNSGGTGDRRSSITISITRDVFNSDTVTHLVDGADSGTHNYVPNGTGFQTKSITIDFRTGRIVDELRVQLAAANDQGTWQVAASNDDSNYTDIGSPVAFTVADPAVLSFTNATSYRYYRLTGSSGTVVQTYWTEIEFKTEDGATTYASSTAYANTLGSGDREPSVIRFDATASMFSGTNYYVFVDGGLNNGPYVPSGTGFIGKSLIIDFGPGTTRIVDEIELTTETNSDQATWQVAASADCVSYSNLGSPKQFPRLTVQLISFHNLTAYRCYRLTGDSGTVSQTYWRELKFRIAAGSSVNPSLISVAGSSVWATSDNSADQNNNLIDIQPTTFWIGTGSGTDTITAEIGVNKTTIPTSYEIVASSSNATTRPPKNWTFDASLDGISWTTLDTQTNVTSWRITELKRYTVTTSDPYRFFRLAITANNGDATYTEFSDLFVYGSTPASFSTLTTPTNMTSNTAPSPYVAAESTFYTGLLQHKAWMVFDTTFALNDAAWIGTGGGADWISIDLSTATYKIQYYEIACLFQSTRTIRDWTLEGSQNNTDWTTIDTVTGATWLPTERRIYTVDTATTAYRYYRLNITDNNGDATYTRLDGLWLYGSLASSPTSISGLGLSVVASSSSAASVQ